MVLTAADVQTLADWLGENREGTALSPEFIAALIDGAVRLDLFGLEDRPVTNRPLDKDTADFFRQCIAEIADPANGGAVFRESQTTKFIKWLRLGTYQEPVHVAGTATSSAMVAALAVTAECTADIIAQGATLPTCLTFLELSMYLGRGVTELETRGGQHGAPAQMMEGGKAAVKFKMQTLDTAI
jgi:hypothetical protein